MSSRYQELLERLLNDDGIDDIVPESRAEAYLMALIKKNGSVDVEGIIIDPNAFGDAEPQDVMAGKIFSSKGGVGMVGTAVDRGAILDALIDGSVTELESNVSSVGANALSYQKSLTSVILPNALVFKASAFAYCSKLQHIDAPNLNTIYTSAFSNCERLRNVNFPNVYNVQQLAFGSCAALETADFSMTVSFGQQAFYRCTNLKSVILRNEETISVISNTDAFQLSTIASGTGYIYVPSALIDQYKAATNWSTYSAQFRALEDYTVDGTTTGALDESKI